MDLWELQALPGGTVTLHDARRDEHRTVHLEPFEIGVFAVTEEQLAEVLGVPAQHPRRPAADLSWYRAIRFCNAASEWEGLERAYSFDGEEVTWHVDSDGYRLPTEAEWEYACRAGSLGPHHGPLPEIAWTALDGVAHPQDVGLKLPNLNGLFDTLGNVWEWCWDLLDPGRYDDYRVFRGGGFADDTWSVRASVRRGGGPWMHHEDVGMRLARGGFDDAPAAQGRSATNWSVQSWSVQGWSVQGWSPQADLERGRRGAARPMGWTPRG